MSDKIINVILSIIFFIASVVVVVFALIFGFAHILYRLVFIGVAIYLLVCGYIERKKKEKEFDVFMCIVVGSGILIFEIIDFVLSKIV